MAKNIKKLKAFEWDEGNKDKNLIKHNVENSESEEVFFNDPVLVYDKSHSQKEERYLAFGVTDRGRLLIISFTIREEKIRVISSRDQDKKENEYYWKNKKERRKKT